MSLAQTARSNMSFGGRVPPLIGALLAATIVLSIGNAISAHFGFSLATYGVLSPHAVLRGEVWRLLTWVYFELSPIALIFGCLMLYWFGRDLAAQWGERWFAWAWFGSSLGIGLLLTVVARFVWTDLLPVGYAGNTAITAGLILVWALAFPERQIRVYFIFPMGGMTLVYIELGLTMLFALYGGLASVLPAAIGEGLALGYMFRGRITRRLRSLSPRNNSATRRAKKPDTTFQVWDEDKQRFRPPKWMN